MVPREQWKRIEEAFDRVIEQPVDARAATLAAMEDTLRLEVEALIAASSANDDVVASIVTRAVHRVRRPTKPMIGRQIGAYRLERELGRGGMGAVYLGVRADDQYKSQVAIKLLHRGLETEQAVSRFRDERQILAALDHPNIVRLIDGGSTSDQLPYLVMEYVQGTPITTYARDHGLAIPERIALFRQVCTAIQFAHGKLVVHRDLKPSNILVTDTGVVKLLDFGIAKLLDDGLPREARTGTGMMLLTPEYASPEQIQGEAITTATDVYSLGVVLYELFCETLPHRLEGSGLGSIFKLVETAPPRPSTVAPIERRRELIGDIDNILLKAIDKDPARRYASADHLAEDLQRYVTGLPVEARAATWGYRARKFVRRNRLAVFSAATIVIALAAATAISISQARVAANETRRAEEATQRAQRRFDEVHSLANALLFDINDEIADLPGATTARKMIVQRAQQYLDRLVAEAVDDAELSRELAIAYMKVGQVQGDPLGPNLGDVDGARASYAKAAAIVDRLAANGSTPAVRELQANLAMLRGTLQQDDMTLLRQAIEITSALPPTVAVLRIRVLSLVGLAEPSRDDVMLAKRYADELQDAVAAWKRLAPSSEARYFDGVAHEEAGYSALRLGDSERAEHEMRTAAAIFEALTAEYPKRASYRRELGYVQRNLAPILSGIDIGNIWLPSQGDREGAMRALRRCDELWVEIINRDPDDSRAISDQAYAWGIRGMILDDAALIERARASWARVGYREEAALMTCAIAAPLAATGHAAQARREIEDARKAIKISSRPLVAEQCEFQIARAQLALGDANAAATLAALTSRLRARVAKEPTNASARIGLVETLLLSRRLSPYSGCSVLEEALDIWMTWPDDATTFTRRRLAELEAELGATKCATRNRRSP
jgi:hypothetical protein